LVWTGLSLPAGRRASLDWLEELSGLVNLPLNNIIPGFIQANEMICDGSCFTLAMQSVVYPILPSK
jgi:hypothetical protein